MDLARLARLDLSQFLAVLFQQVGEFEQHVAAHCRGDLGPVLEATAGGFHRRIDVGRVCIGDVGTSRGRWRG